MSSSDAQQAIFSTSDKSRWSQMYLRYLLLPHRTGYCPQEYIRLTKYLPHIPLLGTPKRSPMMMMMMMMMRQLFRVSWMQARADCAICIFLTPTPLPLSVNFLVKHQLRKDGYDVIDHFIHLSFAFQHSFLKLFFIEAPSFPSCVKPVLQDRVGK